LGLSLSAGFRQEIAVDIIRMQQGKFFGVHRGSLNNSGMRELINMG
jgi:hypothetical protein